MDKATKRQYARTAGGQDLWPRKSTAHEIRATFSGDFAPMYKPEWAREYIKRRLGNALATPRGKLP